MSACFSHRTKAFFLTTYGGHAVLVPSVQAVDCKDDDADDEEQRNAAGRHRGRMGLAEVVERQVHLETTQQKC